MTTTTQFPFSELSDREQHAPGNTARDTSLAGAGAPDALGRRTALFKSLVTNAETEPKPDCRFTAEDVAKAVEEARMIAERDTEATLRAAFAEDVAQRRCDLLAAIKDQLQHQEEAFAQELDHWASVSQKLAVALAQAVIPRTIERHPFCDIKDVIKAAMHRLLSEPSLHLCVPPDLVEAGEALFAEIAEEAGFSGTVDVQADPDLGDGDIALRWQGGTIDRRIDRLQAEALMLIDHLLETSPGARGDDHDMGAPHLPETDDAERAPVARPTDDLHMSEADDEQ